MAGRVAADHFTMNDMLGVGISTNPANHHRGEVRGARSTWVAKHSQTVELFILSPVLSAVPTKEAPATSTAESTEKKIPDANENAKPTPQPRPRLKGADTVDAHAIIGTRDQSAIELGPKAKAFLKKFAGDIESRCALAMAREKIEPVEGMLVRYTVEIDTLDGKIRIKKFTYPSQVATSAFFASVIEDLSPLEQPDPELRKIFGDVLGLEVTLS